MWHQRKQEYRPSFKFCSFTSEADSLHNKHHLCLNVKFYESIWFDPVSPVFSQHAAAALSKRGHASPACQANPSHRHGAQQHQLGRRSCKANNEDHLSHKTVHSMLVNVRLLVLRNVIFIFCSLWQYLDSASRVVKVILAPLLHFL